MKSSVLFRRVFFVVLAAVVAMAVLTSALFSLISGKTFSTLKQQELLPKARAVSSVCASNYADSDLVTALLYMNEKGESALGAYAVITDAMGMPVFATGSISEEQKSLFVPIAQKVLQEGELSDSRYMKSPQIEMVFAGAPIVKSGRPTGAVILFVPSVESLAARSSFSSAVLFSIGCVMPLVVCAVYVIVNMILRPIREVRDAAISMAEGDFNVIALDTHKGEAGQLGRSLNMMAGQISRTVSALTLERNRLIEVLNGLSEGIVAVDNDGRITHYNNSLKVIFEKKEKEEDSKLALVPVPEIWDKLNNVVQTGESITENIEYKQITVKMILTPVKDSEGKIAGAVGLFSDVTQQEFLERTRRDYVANVSHELRTPLTAMRGLVEPLRDGLIKKEEDRQRYYDIILRETMRLSRLINDLMELSRLQSGALAFESERVRVNEIFADILDRYRSIAEDSGITLDTQTNIDTIPDVNANADRVEQLITILVDNAIKYTPEGGTVSINATSKDNKLLISVTDTGIGISESNLPYVFDRFYKVDKAHSGQGSGLGLSIAKEMLLKMGESISVTSIEGQGSTFTFTLTKL